LSLQSATYFHIYRLPPEEQQRMDYELAVQLRLAEASTMFCTLAQYY